MDSQNRETDAKHLEGWTEQTKCNEENIARYLDYRIYTKYKWLNVESENYPTRYMKIYRLNTHGNKTILSILWMSKEI